MKAMEINQVNKVKAIKNNKQWPEKFKVQKMGWKLALSPLLGPSYFKFYSEGQISISANSAEVDTWSGTLCRFCNWSISKTKDLKRFIRSDCKQVSIWQKKRKKMERGGGVFILKMLHKLVFLWLVCRWLRLALEKTSDLLTRVFSVIKSHKTINLASYTTVQDVFPFLGLKYSRAYELSRWLMFILFLLAQKLSLFEIQAEV